MQVTKGITKMNQHFTSGAENFHEDGNEREQNHVDDASFHKSAPKKPTRQQKTAAAFRLIQDWKENEGDIARLTMDVQRSPEKTVFLTALTDAYTRKKELWQKIESRLLEGWPCTLSSQFEEAFFYHRPLRCRR